jgi:protoheme IX farnesyltransferase
VNVAVRTQPAILNYVFALKPRETSLLVFIGMCSAIVAAAGTPDIGRLALVTLALFLGSAGCNGLTNYLDRDVDARMRRTCSRVLPSKKIYPAYKVLPLIISLIISALVLAWFLHPLCFAFGAIGVVASGIWRKTITCTFFGIIASCSPVLIGWFAIKPTFDIHIILLCALIAVWIPIHVWSVMVASRTDYENAGLKYFPLNWSDKSVVRTLIGMSVILFAISIAMYLLTELSALYLGVACILGIMIVYSSTRLTLSTTSKAAWRVYKLSSFPYLGVVFLAMCLDIWLL